jgi:hypothetical protein
MSQPALLPRRPANVGHDLGPPPRPPLRGSIPVGSNSRLRHNLHAPPQVDRRVRRGALPRRRDRPDFDAARLAEHPVPPLLAPLGHRPGPTVPGDLYRRPRRVGTERTGHRHLDPRALAQHGQRPRHRRQLARRPECLGLLPELVRFRRRQGRRHRPGAKERRSSCRIATSLPRASGHELRGSHEGCFWLFHSRCYRVCLADLARQIAKTGTKKINEDTYAGD